MAVSASGDRRDRFRSQALPARLASGFTLAVVSIAACWAGGWYFSLFLFVILMTALWEFLRMSSRAYPVLFIPGLVAGASVLILASTHNAANFGVVLVPVAVWMMGASLCSPIKDRVVGLAVTALGILYVTGLGLHVLWLREMDKGLELLVLVFLGTWAADTFAFFVGVRYGKTPLAPEISPGKSVEGLFGGVLGAVIVTAAAASLLLPDLGFLVSLLLGLVLGALSPVGDLLESMFKRNFSIKDTSRFIPGHGGFLDRIDSLLVTAPVSYYLFRFLLS